MCVQWTLFSLLCFRYIYLPSSFQLQKLNPEFHSFISFIFSPHTHTHTFAFFESHLHWTLRPEMGFQCLSITFFVFLSFDLIPFLSTASAVVNGALSGLLILSPFFLDHICRQTSGSIIFADHSPSSRTQFFQTFVFGQIVFLRYSFKLNGRIECQFSFLSFTKRKFSAFKKIFLGLFLICRFCACEWDCAFLKVYALSSS